MLRWLRLAAPALPAAGFVGLAAFALRDLPLPVPVLAGALVYAAGLKLAGFPQRLGISGFGGLLGGRAGMTTAGLGTETPAHVSVLVPTYRRVARLEQCLEGVARQQLRPDEVLVVHRTDDEETGEFLRGIGPRGTRPAIGRSQSTRRESSLRCEKGSKRRGAT